MRSGRPRAISSAIRSTNPSVTYSSATDCSVIAAAPAASARSTSERLRSASTASSTTPRPWRGPRTANKCAMLTGSRSTASTRNTFCSTVELRSNCSSSTRRMPPKTVGDSGSFRKAPSSPPNTSRMLSPTTFSASALPANRSTRPAHSSVLPRSCLPVSKARPPSTWSPTSRSMRAALSSRSANSDGDSRLVSSKQL